MLLFIHTRYRTLPHRTDFEYFETVSQKSLIAKRNFRNMDTAVFSDDIKSSYAGICAQVSGQQTEELITSSNTYLSDYLDKHSP